MILLVWRSKPSFHFGVQRHRCFILAFKAVDHFSVLALRATVHSRFMTFGVIRATIVSQFRRSESSSCFQFNVQCHIFSFGVQSHHCHVSRFQCSEPSSHLCSAFRAITHQYQCSELSLSHSQFRRAEPPSFPSLTFRVAFLVSVFRAIITSSFGVQSHHSSVSMFRAILVVFSVSAFRAIITPQFDVQSHILVRRSKPLHHSFRRSEPCFASFDFQSPCPLRFGVRSHCISFVSASRAMFCFVWLSEPLSTSIWSSEPLHIIRFNIQSHVLLRSASKASSSSDIQVHIFIWRSKPHPHSVFRAIICFFYYLFRVPSRGFGSALRVLMSIFRSIHHHFPPFWRSEPLGTLLQAF